MRGDEAILSPASFWMFQDSLSASAWSLHAPFAFWLIDALRPRCLVEVGALNRGSLPVFRQAIDRLGLETACIAIAGWGDDERIFSKDNNDSVSDGDFLHSLFIRHETARYTLPLPYRNCIDLFYIDGRRPYKDVKYDFDVLRGDLTESGVVLLHGTTCSEFDSGAQRLFEELKADYPSYEFTHGEGLGILCPGLQVPEPLRLLTECSEEVARSTRLAYARLGEAVADRQELRDLRTSVETLRGGIHALHRFEANLTEGEIAAVPLGMEVDPTILHVVNVRTAEREAAASAAATVRELETALNEARAGETAAKGESSDLRCIIGTMRQVLAGRDKAIARLSRAEQRARRLARAKDDLRTLLARNALRDKEVEAVRSKREMRLHDLAAASQRQVEILRRSWADERQARLNLELRLASIEDSRVWKQLARFHLVAGRRLLPAKPLIALKEEDIAIICEIEQTGLFDATYYAEQNPDLAPLTHPALHFARSGWREGRRPNPDFDPIDYLARHPSVFTRGLNPLTHFAENLRASALDKSRSEGGHNYLEAAGNQDLDVETVRASCLFDLSFYREQNPDVIADSEALITHYLRVGWQELRDPSAAFNTSFYLSQNPDVAAAGVNPLLHFIEVGQQERRAPRAPVLDAAGGPLPVFGLSEEERAAAEAVMDTGLFDADFYCSTYSEALLGGRHPAVDYAVDGWRKDRDPTSSFDTKYYLKQNGDVAASGQNPLVHYANAGAVEGRHPIAEADPAHYDRQEKERLAQEIVETGLFDEVFYGVHNPDIVERGLDPALHFATWGWTERRRPHPAFDPIFYLERNPDVAALNVNPLLHYVQIGIYEGRRPAAAQSSGKSMDQDYAGWTAAYDTLTDNERRVIEVRQAQLSHRPLVSMLMPVRNADLRLLHCAIRSVQVQIYPHWELWISDDASTDPRIGTLAHEMAKADARIKLIKGEQAGGEAAFRTATGEFIALMGQDDELPEQALFAVIDALNRAPDHDLIYSDEDRIDLDGNRSKPYFKPNYSPELMLGHDLVGHLAVYRRSLVERIGGFRLGYEGAEGYDLALRLIDTIGPKRILHIPQVLYHRRSFPGKEISSQGFVGRGVASARRAIEDHLGRKGEVGDVVAHSCDPSWHRVIRARPNPAPLVSIIVPTKDKVDLLKPCCDGILRRTDYPNIELIVVDHQSTEPEAMAYISDLTRDNRVRIMRFEGVFNYSAINNAAAREAKGSVFAFLNNDVDVIKSDWLDEMVSLVCLPEIGVVGAKLLYADDRIQHGGIVLGVDGVAGHSFHLLGRDDPGYVGRANLTATVSAVTGACLVVRKETFDSVRGFDEINLSIGFNDIDLCLKVQQLGLRNVIAAHAILYHYESISRGHDTTTARVARFKSELKYMQDKWGGVLHEDPYYSPNLNGRSADFTLAFPPRQIPFWKNRQSQ